jgi:hypothetical protein
VEWEGNPNELDADEIVVRAADEATAITKATAKWTTTIGADWPHIRITGARVVKRKVSMTDISRF